MGGRGTVLSTKEGYDALAKIWLRESDCSLMKRQYAEFKEHCRGKKVLDVGCATGRDTLMLSGSGYEVTGIDFSSKMLELAACQISVVHKMNEDRGSPEKPEPVLYQMRIENLGFRDGSFDGIWCSSMLQHVDKKEAAEMLKNFNSILSNNGVLYVTVGDMGSEPTFSKYSLGELEAMVKEAGFEIIDHYKEKRNGKKTVNVFARVRRDSN